MNSKEFSLKVENIVKEKKCSYMDGVVLAWLLLLVI